MLSLPPLDSMSKVAGLLADALTIISLLVASFRLLLQLPPLFSNPATNLTAATARLAGKSIRGPALEGATFCGLPTRELMPACVLPLAFGLTSLASGRFWRRARARTERRAA